MSLDLIQSIRAKSKLAISKAISLIENKGEDGHAFLSDIYKGIPTSQQSMTRQVAPSVSPLMQAGAVGLAGLTGAAAAQRLGLFGG